MFVWAEVINRKTHEVMKKSQWGLEFKVNNSTRKAGFEIEAVDQKYKRVQISKRDKKYSDPHLLKI